MPQEMRKARTPMEHSYIAPVLRVEKGPYSRPFRIPYASENPKPGNPFKGVA